MANIPNIDANENDEKKQEAPRSVPVVNNKRGPYNNTMTPERKLVIAKLASQIGVSMAIASYPDWKVAWSSAKDWMTKYKIAKAELGCVLCSLFCVLCSVSFTQLICT